MTPTDPPRHGPVKRTGRRRGLVIVYTGDGKGKTTAALGLLLRAHGRGLTTALYQFIKRRDARFGEHHALDALGIPHAGLGDGFSWRSHDLDQSRSIAAQGWLAAKTAILGGGYDLVVLDEITYPITWGWIDLHDILDTLQQRPPSQHVVLTGRDADPALIDLADTVTDMRKLKHAFDADVPAQRGVEH